MAMLIDRDAYNETFGNLPAFEAQGIKMEHGWDTHAPMGWPEDWLDPKAGKLGDASKYWKFNVDEATKLLKAAGAFGMEFPYNYIGAGGISTDIYRKQNEVILAMLNNAGAFKAKPNLVDSAAYIQKYTFGRGQYDGVAYVPTGGLPDMDMFIHAIYMPGGRNDYVTTKENTGAASTSPSSTRAKSTRRSARSDARLAEGDGGSDADLPVQGNNEWTQFTLNWPKLGNYWLDRHRIDGRRLQHAYENYWYDKSKDV